MRANISTKDEIGFLAARFNTMIETLHEFYTDLEDKAQDQF